MAKSQEPTGITVKRNENKYTAKWKTKAKSYEGQAAQWTVVYKGKGNTVKNSFKAKRLTNAKIKKTSKSSQYSIDLDDYFPNTKANGSYKKKLKAVAFRVRGTEKGKTASDWTYGSFKIKPPRRVKGGNSLKLTVDEYPSCKLEYSVPTSAIKHRPFTNVQYEYKLVTEWNGTDLKDISWSGSTKGTSTRDSGSISIPVDSGVISDGKSHTLCVRIISQGPGGNAKEKDRETQKLVNAYRYKRHVFAQPLKPSISDCTCIDYLSTYNVLVDVTAPKSPARPVDQVRLEYIIGYPDAEMQPPAGSWTEVDRVDPGSKNPGFIADIDAHTTYDEAMWIRAVSTHDERDSLGTAYLVKETVNKLSTPSALSVSFDTSRSEVTVAATNEAATNIPDSMLVIRFYDSKHRNGIDIGIIDGPSETVKYPDGGTDRHIAVYAVLPSSYYYTPSDDGHREYTIVPYMTSNLIEEEGAVITAPQNVKVTAGTTTGSALVSWSWNDVMADGAELSWSDSPDSWMSTAEPQTYDVRRASSSWIISGLTTGITYYVRVRFYRDEETGRVYGGYSATYPITLEAKPSRPVVEVSKDIIPITGTTEISWTYDAPDKVAQTGAVIAEYIDETEEPHVIGTIIGTDATYTINPSTIDGWTTGDVRMICVKVKGSAESPWSEPVPITIANPVSASFFCSLVLTNETVVGEDGEETQNRIIALQELPLRIATHGGGESNIVTVAVERAEDYYIERPDESRQQAFEGDTIFFRSFVGDRTIAIDYDDLMAPFDESHIYRIVVTVSDGLGQTATADSMTIEPGIDITGIAEFQVAWTNQAAATTADIEIDKETQAAFLTPHTPPVTREGDVCDIYRLSADKPVLIYEGATFEGVYVDPYPAIGPYGGHRFVVRTQDGDITTEDGHFSWTDYGESEGDTLAVPYNIIDFPGGSARLIFNAEINSSWNKDFTETKYLGGRVTGDWNPAVSRTVQVTAEAALDYDPTIVETMRRLADYAGICHVRTKDGSSFAADVQVSESYNYATGPKTMSYTLSITRVQPEGLDGMTLEEWEKIHGEE